MNIHISIHNIPSAPHYVNKKVCINIIIHINIHINIHIHIFRGIKKPPNRRVLSDSKGAVKESIIFQCWAQTYDWLFSSGNFGHICPSLAISAGL